MRLLLVLVGLLVPAPVWAQHALAQPNAPVSVRILGTEVIVGRTVTVRADVDAVNASAFELREDGAVQMTRPVSSVAQGVIDLSYTALVPGYHELRIRAIGPDGSVLSPPVSVIALGSCPDSLPTETAATSRKRIGAIKEGWNALDPFSQADRQKQGARIALLESWGWAPIVKQQDVPSKRILLVYQCAGSPIP